MFAVDINIADEEEEDPLALTAREPEDDETEEEEIKCEKTKSSKVVPHIKMPKWLSKKVGTNMAA